MILRAYTGASGAYYAQVVLSDGQRVELKSAESLNEAQWVALAEEYEAAMALPDVDVGVEAEDGEII